VYSVTRSVQVVAWWRNGKVSDFQSNGRGFDSRSGHYISGYYVDE